MPAPKQRQGLGLFISTYPPLPLLLMLSYVSFLFIVSIPSGTVNMSPPSCEGRVGQFSLPLVLLPILSSSPHSCCVAVLQAPGLTVPFHVPFAVGLPGVHLLGLFVCRCRLTSTFLWCPCRVRDSGLCCCSVSPFRHRPSPPSFPR